MNQTDCFGIPYPECDPPLTKDTSDIEQFRDLALAVDAAVQELDDRVTEYLSAPDSAAMDGALTTAGRIQDIPYTTTKFDNASMSSPIDARLKIQSDGWYLVGGWVQATHTNAVGIGMRVQPTVNGDPVSNRQGPGRPVLSGASSDDCVAWQTVLQLSVGDLVGLRTNHGDSTALVVTYNSVLWATRILANV